MRGSVAGPKRDALRLGHAIANVIVAQMLPDGVVKSGSSLMLKKDEPASQRHGWRRLFHFSVENAKSITEML